MSSTPIKKQLIGFIFLLLICFSVPLGAAAGETYTYTVEPGDAGIRLDFSLVLCPGPGTPCNPIGGGLTWGLSPNNGTATLSTSAEADGEGRAWFELDFNANACGTYTVTVRLTRDPRSTSNIKFIISGKPPCSPGSSSETSSSSSEVTTSPPPPQLVKISDANQVTRPEDGVTLSVQLEDSDGSLMSDVDVTFRILSGDRSRASLSPTRATTDANGRAQATLTFSPDATGQYIINVHRSDNPNIYTVFTITVDPLLPKATRLEKISGDNQTGLTGGVWAAPFVVEVRDQYDVPLEGVPVTFTILTGGGILSAETTRTNANGLATSTLRLGTEAGTNTVEVSVEGLSETVTFTAEAPLPPPIPTTLSIISGENQQGFIGAPLTNPFIVQVHDQYGQPMEGVIVTFAVTIGDSSLSGTTTITDQDGQAKTTLTLGTAPGTVTIEASVEGIAQTATFNAVAELLEFNLSLSTGLNLIHLPLKVRAVDGMPATIQSVSDLYNVLGGAGFVNFLITLDSPTQAWHSYFGTSDTATLADRTLTDTTGILAGMKAPVSVRLGGDALGTDGTSTITLNQSINLVGLPLKDSRVTRVSDLFKLDGIGGNVPVIILSDAGGFQLVGRVGDPGDSEIAGGQAFIMTAQQPVTITISGEAWTNVSGAAAAPPVTRKGIDVGNTTPVLALKGLVLDEEAGLNKLNFWVTVKNLSTGRAVTGMTRDEGMEYRLTVVDIETARVATLGDILEISAQSPNPFIGVEPLRYTVTAEDVKRSWIQLPELAVYKIPAETQLLANYPNPFNPETWIPYRLAEDAFVTLTIYDGTGQVVRTLDVGHRIASAYENRSKAIYWDGRNHVGERVASGVYFYTLTAGDFSATRKMLIIK